MRIGTPGQPVELVLATNTEWTMVTSVNCTTEFGCSKGIYDAKKSDSEFINETSVYKTVNVSNAKSSSSVFITSEKFIHQRINNLICISLAWTSN